MDRYINLADEAKFGSKFGQPCNIRRIDYTASDQVGTIVDSTKRYYLAKTGDQWATFQNAEVEEYRISGDFNAIQLGDVIEPQAENGWTSTTPKITVLAMAPNHGTFGFKTDRIGKISNGSTDIYTNILFSFIPDSDYIGKPLNREIAASLGIQSTEIAIYSRPQLESSLRDSEGLLFTVTDGPFDDQFRIVHASTFGNLVVLNIVKALEY